MTIQLQRSDLRNNPVLFDPAMTQPADVWDIPSPVRPVRTSSPVRTLSGQSRTPERLSSMPPNQGSHAVSSFETRRERRVTFLMGAGLGLALTVGSVVGGAFASDTTIGSPDQPAVSATVAR